MRLIIRGIGTAVPLRSIDQRDAADVARTFLAGRENRLSVLPRLYSRARVNRRSSVLLEEPQGERYRMTFYPQALHSGDRGPSTGTRVARYAREAPRLAAMAARGALDSAKWTPESVTHLITVSCTGFDAPGVEFSLIEQLGLSCDIGRLNVGYMGCHGALNALRAAHALAASEPESRVLLCSVELCTLHYYYGWDTEKMVANALFADGAAAMAVESATAGERDWELVACGSRLVPDSMDEMTWRIGDHGFEMTLSARVPDLLGSHLRPWLTKWLDKFDLTIEQIGSWAIHPGGPRILQAAHESLGLTDENASASYDVLSEHGNMSSATVLFVIDRLRRSGAALPCVALGFGPGLVLEAALFV